MASKAAVLVVGDGGLVSHFTGPEDFNFMAGLSCATRCGPVVRTELRRCALELAGGNVALIGTTTLIDQVASHETLLLALSEFGTQSLHPELANIPSFSLGTQWGDAPRTGSAAFTAPGCWVHDHEGRLPQH